jgi:hypothetical protein
MANHNVLWNKRRVKRPTIILNRIVLSTFGLISENKNIETTLLHYTRNRKKHPIYYLIMKNIQIIKEGGKIPQKTGKLGENDLEDNVILLNMWN